MKRKILIAFLAVTMASIILIAAGSAAIIDKGARGRIPTSGIVALLADPSGINGTVTDAVSMLPIKGANVSTFGGVSDLTDSEGHYDLTVAAGGWLVTVMRLGYNSQSKNASVIANKTTTLNFALSPNPAQMGWIAGNVTNANTSAAIAGATVEVDGYSTTTNTTGRYKIQVPAPWNYSVTASKVGFQDKTVNGVHVNAGNMTTTLNIKLTPVPPQTMGTLMGNVTDAATHMPITNAVIMAGNKTAMTNSTGLYKLQLAAGTYNVTAGKSGYANQTKMGIVIKAGNATTLNFALNKTTPPPQQIEAKIKIHPKALNLRSHGKWISITIKLEKGFNARDINISSIKLNGNISVSMNAPVTFSHSKLTVKFDRQAVQSLIISQLNGTGKFKTVTLTITGKLNDGTTFSGSTTIKAIYKVHVPEPKLHHKKW